jgi:5-methylcytosine-specific restriction endonuclease McrA
VNREEELKELALSLRRNTSYFSSGWNIRFLQAFIRDGGNCVYCDRDVMNEFCIACGDHLLPKHIYPALKDSVDNIVAACSHCNRIKGDFDPSDGKDMKLA